MALFFIKSKLCKSPRRSRASHWAKRIFFVSSGRLRAFHHDGKLGEPLEIQDVSVQMDRDCESNARVFGEALLCGVEVEESRVVDVHEDRNAPGACDRERRGERAERRRSEIASGTTSTPTASRTPASSASAASRSR